MSTPVVISGAVFQVPVFGERGWSDDASSLLVALANNVLFMDGNTQTAHPLTNDANFGPTNGLVSAYFTARTSDPTAASGSVRLAQANKIAWKASLSAGDLLLGVAADVLQFEGDAVVLATAAQTITNKNLASVTNVLTGATAANLYNAGTVTIPTGPETLVGRATTDTLSSKTIDADVNTISNLEVDNLKAGVLNTSTTLAGASNTQIPSAAAVAALVASTAAGGGAKADKATVLTAGVGLAGGGDLSADRTFSVNVDGTTIEISADTLQLKDGAVSTLKLATDVTTDINNRVIKNADIGASTATKITYDAKGLVTGGTSLAPSDIPALVDASKIADGSVSDTEFQYLGGVTSDLQTQLNDRVVGPGSSTNNRLATFSGTTGKVVQESTVTADSSGNLVVPGDLTVNGTTTSVNSTNLDVADKQITVNKGGVSPSAEGAGIAVESDGSAVSSLAYDSTKPSKWTADGVELVNVNASQTLSGKTLDFLRTQTEAVGLSGGILSPSKGLSRITGGGTTLNVITGNNVDGATQTLYNNSGSDIVVTNVSNIVTGTGVDFTLKNGAAITLAYSANTSKWLLTGGAGSGGLALSTNSTTFTAAINTHYLCTTAGGAFTVTLPTGVAGAVIRLSDDARTWGTNNLTITPASGQIIGSLAANESLVCDLTGAWVQLNWDGSKWVVDTNGYAAAINSGGAGGLVPEAVSTTVNPASTGKHYLTDTTSAAFTITLPTGASGNTIKISDAARNWNNKAVTIAPASGQKINGYSTNETLVCDTAGGWVELNWNTVLAAWSMTSSTLVSPVVNQGAAISEWQSYTPDVRENATNLGSITSQTGTWRRVGSNMEVRFFVRSAAARAGTGTLRVGLPAGYSVNTSATNNYNVIGTGSWYTGTAYDEAVPLIFESGVGGTTGISIAQPGGNAVYTADAFDLNVEIAGLVSVPIAEWAGNGTVNLGAGAQVEYAYNFSTTNTNDTTSFGYGPAGGSLISSNPAGGGCNKTVRFQNPIQPDDMIILEVSPNGDGKWFPIPAMDSGANPLESLHQEATDYFGLGIYQIPGLASTDIALKFGHYPCSPFTDTTGYNWPSYSAWKYRVRKCKASAPVGFGMAGTDGSSGLVQAGRMPGLVTGTTIGAGYVGEYKLSEDSAFTNDAANGYFYTGKTLALTPGVWQIWGYVSAFKNGATVNNTVGAIISTNSNNDGTGGIGAGNSGATFAWTDATSTVSPRIVNISTTTNYYLKGYNGASAGTPQHLAGIFAVRIA
jgi:hypothetical protein